MDIRTAFTVGLVEAGRSAQQEICDGVARKLATEHPGAVTLRKDVLALGAKDHVHTCFDGVFALNPAPVISPRALQIGGMSQWQRLDDAETRPAAGELD